MSEKTITLIKKIAAVLLLVCFVLPLSRCTAKMEVDGQTKISDSSTFGYEIAARAWVDKSLNTLLAVSVVFFVPAVCLGLRKRPQAVIYFFSSFVSAYVLAGWVFIFATMPEIGGILATICWTLLFGLSCITLWGLYRRGTLFNRHAKG